MTIIKQAGLWTYEHAIFQYGTVINEGAILNFDVIADFYVKINIYIFSNDAISSNHYAFSNLDEMPYPGSLAYLCLLRHLSGCMNRNIIVYQILRI